MESDPYNDLRLPTTYLLSGNTFPVKDKLRELGCFWDYKRSVWIAPNREIAQKAQDLIYEKERRDTRMYIKNGSTRTSRKCGSLRKGKMS